MSIPVFPDIIDHKLDETVDFMVLACDGWLFKLDCIFV
jgi:serine/threonine protein phosphatase PrpC